MSSTNSELSSSVAAPATTTVAATDAPQANVNPDGQAQAQSTTHDASVNAIPTLTSSTDNSTTLTPRQLELLQTMTEEPTTTPPTNESQPTAQSLQQTPPSDDSPAPAAQTPSRGQESLSLAPEPQIPQTPQTYLTFLLISGRRKTMSFEPETTVGRVKELIWNAWPSDWQDERPPAPSYLRILYLGKMLQDDETLSNLKLPTHTPPPTSTPSTDTDAATPTSSGPPARSRNTPTGTIMHISIRPFAPVNEAEASTFKKKRRGTRDSSVINDQPNPQDVNTGCCGCVIC